MLSALCSVAQFQRIAYPVLRSLLLLCAAFAMSGCGGSDGPSGTPGSGQSTSLANLSAVSGDAQEALLGTSLTDDIVVAARNPLGLLATGVTISATASAGGAVTPATTSTDAAGEARFRWTLGRTEGEQTLTVTTATGGRPVTFRASGVRLSLNFSCGTVPTLGCGFGPEQFSPIPRGTFQMGSTLTTAEQPIHTVTISSVRMQRTEVTQGQWRAVMTGTTLANSSFFSVCGDLCPVEQVSWNDVQVFLARLNTVTPGVSYRLPTEAEWEYAARAGTTAETYGILDAIAWYSVNSGSRTRPVAGKVPNAFGLYDMLGNVWEWVSDAYGPYAPGAVTDPTGPAGTASSRRVLRGGAWGYDATDVRAGYRFGYFFFPSERNSYNGFRLVRTP